MTEQSWQERRAAPLRDPEIKKRAAEAKAARFRERAMHEGDVIPDKKKCNGPCGEWKSSDEFYPRRYKTKAGVKRVTLSSYCKVCERAALDARTARKREEMGEEAWEAHRKKIYKKSNRKPSTRARKREFNSFKRREAGVPVRPLRSRENFDTGDADVPAAPIGQWLREFKASYDEKYQTDETLSHDKWWEAQGVSAKRIYNLTNDLQVQVRLSTVDKILTAAGVEHLLPILYPTR